MRNGPVRRPLFLLLMLAPLLFTSQVQGQDEGPVVIGEQRKLPPFGLEMPHGSFDFFAQHGSDRSTAPNSPESRSEENLFQESITLETQAYAVHPNFFDLHARGTFGLEQDYVSSTQGDDHGTSELYLWDIQGIFLRQQPTNLTLYTDRTENIVDRAFSSSFRDTFTTYGAFLQSQNKEVPTTVRVYRFEQDQTDLSGNADFSYYENALEWHSEATPTPYQFLSFDYRLSDTNQDSSGNPDLYSHAQSASLGHSVSFGPEHRFSLNSTAGWSDSTGPFGVDRTRLDEVLHVNHNDHLETKYEYVYDKQVTTVDQVQQRATAEIRHKLYQSLVSHGQIGYLDLDVSDGSETKEWFANVDEEYNKKVPFGSLLGTLHLGYDDRHANTGGEPLPVTGQPLTFPSFLPVVIPGPSIDPNSVIIRDSLGFVIPQAGNYTVQQRPDGIQITPLPGGQIAPGDPLLLDYIVNPIPDYDLISETFNIGGRYNFEQGVLKGVSPYARFGLLEQSVTGGGGLVQPDSVRDYVGGVEYHFWDVTLSAEQEKYKSLLVPFDATHLGARLDTRLSGTTLLGLNATYALTDYTKQFERNETTVVGGSITHYLTRELSVYGSGNWVYIEDSIGGRTQGVQGSVEVRWHHRQLEVYARARASSLDSDTESSRFELFNLGIRREF